MGIITRDIGRYWGFSLAEIQCGLRNTRIVPQQALGLFIMIVVQVEIWRYVARMVHDSVSGISPEMIGAYAVNARIMAYMLPGRACMNYISERINSGAISVELVRPISLVVSAAFAQVGRSSVSAMLYVVPAVALSEAVFRVPYVDVHAWGSIVGAMGEAYALGFLLNYTLGLCSIWVGSSWGMLELTDAMTLVFGGALVPVSLYPAWLEKMCQGLPFEYMYFTSSGALSGLNIGQGLVYGAVWVAVLALLAIWMSRKLAWRLVIRGG